MTDRPLGIADITKALADTEHPAWPALSDHWYWCRRHEQAEHASYPSPTISADAACIRIGPFMSRREANRLGDKSLTKQGWISALGMEVES